MKKLLETSLICLELMIAPKRAEKYIEEYKVMTIKQFITHKE